MKLRLKKRINEIGDIISFIFSSSDLTSWQAGQYINLTMPNVPPALADRLFTIASAPSEKEIRITTYIGTSDFKKQMNLLQPGQEVEADQLGGDFIWVEDGRKKLFIAGGIGSTTFRSIVLDRISQNLPCSALLLYAGYKERRPFVDEFKKFSSQDPQFSVKHYVETRLTLQQILEDVPDVDERLIYLSGSQPFVEGLGDGLMAHGIERAQIKYDYFDGYEDLEY